MVPMRSDLDAFTNPELTALRAEALSGGDARLAADIAALVAERVRRHHTGERLDVYDDALRHTGVKERGRVHLDGDWHRSFHCWLVSPARRTLLVQRRSAAKATFPGALDVSVAGHYRAGEGVRQGCRESEEELGLQVDPDRLIPMGRSVTASRHGYLIDREVADVFLYTSDVRPEALTPDPDEVGAVLEVPLADGLAMFVGEREACLARVFPVGDGPAQPVAAGGSGWSQPHGGAPAGPPWDSVAIRPSEFTTHYDRYYSRLFLQAQRIAAGLPPLPV